MEIPPHLKVPLYAAATNKPGRPGNSARMSITKYGRSYTYTHTNTYINRVALL